MDHPKESKDKGHPGSGAKTAFWRGVATGALSLLSLGIVIILIVAYSGMYNIAATEQHTAAARWLFDTTFHSSVRSRARDESPTFTPAAIAAGASGYKAMCQHCHAGPGVGRSAWASGMRPRPPHLAEAAREWAPEEIFWLAKHGAKMTGMPAFGPTHSDRELWNIVAFVKALPGMTAEQYAKAGGQAGHHSGAAGRAQQHGPS